MTLLAGGVGGARMARALRSVVDPGFLTIVVNVGDDTERYGVHVSPDPDTVLYTLAGEVGEHGWGRAGDTFSVMEEFDELGFETSFRLGDRDLALCLARATMLAEGVSLAQVTDIVTHRFGIEDVRLIPATNGVLRTWIQTEAGEWIDFQEYFVDRHHADPVAAVAYHGAAEAEPAPGIVEAIDDCDVLVVAPSNPPLSIWPILAIDELRAAVERHPCTVGVSPLFGGKPLKGPADEVMRGIGLPAGNRGVLAAYDGLLDYLFIDSADAADTNLGPEFGVRVIPSDTRLTPAESGTALASSILEQARS